MLIDLDSSPVKIETTYKYDSPPRYAPHRHSPPRYSSHTYVHRSPPRIQVEETKYVSPGRVSVTRHYHSPPRNASPMRGLEEDELVQSLIQLLSLENRLENAKQALALRPNFTYHDAFKIFDFSGYGRIGTIDIKDAYRNHGIPISLEEARLIISRYDRDKDETLVFNEFTDLFTPIDPVSGEALKDRSYRFLSGYYMSPEILDPVTRGDFTTLLHLILDTENLAESIRQKHSSRPLFDRSDAFDAISKFGDGKITKEDFSDLLRKHRFFANSYELNSLMDRFDKHKKGTVTYSDFIDEITPHSPARY